MTCIKKFAVLVVEAEACSCSLNYIVAIPPVSNYVHESSILVAWLSCEIILGRMKRKPGNLK